MRDRADAHGDNTPRPEESYSPARASTTPTSMPPRSMTASGAPAERQRRAEAHREHLGLGHDIRVGLTQLSPEQLDAVRQIVCRLIAGQFRNGTAYGAGWTDHERQQPVGDNGPTEPCQADAIAARELERALADPVRSTASRTSSDVGRRRTCSMPTA